MKNDAFFVRILVFTADTVSFSGKAMQLFCDFPDRLRPDDWLLYHANPSKLAANSTTDTSIEFQNKQHFFILGGGTRGGYLQKSTLRHSMISLSLSSIRARVRR